MSAPIVRSKYRQAGRPESHPVGIPFFAGGVEVAEKGVAAFFHFVLRQIKGAILRQCWFHVQLSCSTNKGPLEGPSLLSRLRRRFQVFSAPGLLANSLSMYPARHLLSKSVIWPSRKATPARETAMLPEESTSHVVRECLFAGIKFIERLGSAERKAAPNGR